MTIYQRTAEWYAAHCGKPTASQAVRIMAVKKDGSPTAERQERMTGSLAEHFVTGDMQHGIDLEDTAIRAYEAMTGMMTERGCWIDCGTWGCTPDAFVEADGLLSVKCPRSTTIVRQRFFDHDIPQEYYWQAIAEMAATGRQWCDLIRYDDRFRKVADHAWIVRIDRSAADVANWLAEVDRFNAEIAERLQNAGGTPLPPAAAPGAPAASTVEHPAGTYPLIKDGTGETLFLESIGDWCIELDLISSASADIDTLWKLNQGMWGMLMAQANGATETGYLYAVSDHFETLRKAARLEKGLGA